MSGVRTIRVEAADEGLRVDRWFKRHFPGLGHGRLEKLLRTGQVRVDGGRVKAGTRLETGQSVRVPPLPEAAEQAAAPAKPSAGPRPGDRDLVRSLILHEDDSVIVLNKPPGLAVQGGSGTVRHLDAMLGALERKGERPRLVHRLDRDTSGALVVARTRKAAAALAKSFQTRRTRKLYWGLTSGVPKPRRGEIDLALAKQGGPAREKMGPAGEAPDARRAITRYAVLGEAPPRAAWLALSPVTGRTHQLRAHCAAIGTPLIGDRKYGGAAAQPGGFDKRLHLHARSLTFLHPDGREISVTAPLPDHMERAFGLLGFDPGTASDPFAEEGS
ncbi:MAG: RluA family pseudouridine synthase [Alphaproteobacteria bacterium]